MTMEGQPRHSGTSTPRGSLQTLLELALGHQRLGIALGVATDDAVLDAAIHGGTITRPVRIGCIAKALTATLVAIAASEGRLCLDAPIGAYLPPARIPAKMSGAARAICVYHLLNHTSGLDHSRLAGLPRSADGRIDARALLTDLAQSGSIAPPGRLYGYSNVGPWLAAAILETVYRRTYAELLERLLFAPLGIAALSRPEAKRLCPAQGGDLRLSATDLLRIGRWYLDGDPARPGLHAHLRALYTRHAVPLPRLPLGGVQAYPGWVDYGNSFGQVGFGDDGAGLLRFLPTERTVIAIAAANPQLVHAALATVLRPLLADFRSVCRLHLLTATEWAAIDPAVYLGVYANARYRLSISLAASGLLQVAVHSRQSGTAGVDAGPAPYLLRRLRAARNDVFLPEQPEPEVCPVLVFSEPADGGFRYLSTRVHQFVRADGDEQ
ncbi:MAG: beta-lactamase family protein [Gammaproteobacteria bacterium]|nr:beta-lactamase family protein [Gammaproteobacteria bacterium]